MNAIYSDFLIRMRIPSQMEEFSFLMGKCAIHNSFRIRKSEIGAGASPAPTISSEIVGATLAVAPIAVAPDRRVTVGDIVGAYKSLVANACLKIYKSNHQTTGKLWQRNFGKIGKLYRENFHFSWKRVPNQIPCGSGFLKFSSGKPAPTKAVFAC